MRITPITLARVLLVAALALAISGCGRSTPLSPKPRYAKDRFIRP